MGGGGHSPYQGVTKSQKSREGIEYSLLEFSDKVKAFL